jgi:hypothetical protein
MHFAIFAAALALFFGRIAENPNIRSLTLQILL